MIHKWLHGLENYMELPYIKNPYNAEIQASKDKSRQEIILSFFAFIIALKTQFKLSIADSPSISLI